MAKPTRSTPKFPPRLAPSHLRARSHENPALMKGRSHQLPPSDPPDAWGDGSWTVDCSCGVTFDDGEEMVSCDECGIWVHTRCSRFVRGEASFACHKCKAAARQHTLNDSTEETEVAQLLIELPTKAADPGPPQPLPMPPLPIRRPHVPIKDRVHVQGIPGGDPALFQGVSPVFSQQLWKCKGYIPKKFNYKYQEVPYCDEVEDGENPASKGADLLFSLSKEVIPRDPVKSMLKGIPSQIGVKKHGMNKGLGNGGRSQASTKKERSRIHMLGDFSSKRRKEKSGEGKKRSVGESDLASADIERKGSGPLVSMNKAVFDVVGGIQVVESDIPNSKSEHGKEEMVAGPRFAEDPEGMEDGSKPRHVLVTKSSRGDEASRQRSLLENPLKVKVEKVGHLEAVVSQGEGSDAAKEFVVEEDVSKAVYGLNQSKDENHFEGVLNGSSCGVVIESENIKSAIDDLAIDDLRNSYADGEDAPVVPSTNDAISPISKVDKINVNLEDGDDQDGKLQGTGNLLQHLQKSISHSSENLQEKETVATLPPDEQKSQDIERDSEASYQTCHKNTEGKVNRSSEPKLHGQVVESTGSSTMQRDSLEPRHGSKYVDGPTKLGCSNPSLPTPNVRKLVVGFGKVSSASSALALSRSSVSGSYKSLGTAASSTVAKAFHLTKQQRVKVPTVECAKECIQEISGQSVNDHPKDSECSGLKSSDTSKASYASSKHTIFESKEHMHPLSPKDSTTANTTILSSSGGAFGSSEAQKDPVQIKMTSSGLCQKNEKVNQSVSRSSSKVLNHSMAMHPPAAVNATTPLSDEELALLLHQELNSSPRVPRVPRIRQAAGTQMTSLTATSILKRSSSGGKDQVSVFKRRSKEDASRDSFRNSHVSTDETKRMGRVPSSPDQKHPESASVTNGSTKKDAQNRSPDIMASVKKNDLVDSIEGTSNCLNSFEVGGQKGLSIWSSPRNVSDDVGILSCRTLPGLIDEILSKGRRMTYEELCEAVRPHWLNLRKPNGERYAYSSHSHAVLDCLRNRNEWAHLIDRGPKTNSSKRRRKHDSDTPTVESENEESRNRALRESENINVESHREDFPKGKRKARKRRRLELRGSGVREARKRWNQDAVSDDDPAAFSHSSNDATGGNFSDNESQGAGQPAAGDVVSSSGSDDTD